MRTINYLLCPPSQGWLSKWQNKEAGFILRAGSEGKSQIRTPIHSPDASSKPRPQLAWQRPDLGLHLQGSGSEAGVNPNHSGLAPRGLGHSECGQMAAFLLQAWRWGPVSPAHASPSPQPASFHEDDGLADGPWLPLVWTPSPGNHAVWGLGGPKPPSTAHPATVLHLNPLPHQESKAGEASAWEVS